MRPSSAVTRLGVNARLTRARSSVWYGGSWKIIGANVSIGWSISSSTVPRAELNVSMSRDAS
jgi:hypothetical protein